MRRANYRWPAISCRIWPGPERLVIMTVRSAPPLVKTEMAADYVQRHARSPLTRAHTAVVQQAIAVCRATENPAGGAAALTGLLAAVAECAGNSWLIKANTGGPDVARFTALWKSAAEPTPASGSPKPLTLMTCRPWCPGPPTGHSDHRPGLRHPG